MDGLWTFFGSKVGLAICVLLAALGVFVQWQTGMRLTVVEYNRWEGTTGSTG